MRAIHFFSIALLLGLTACANSTTKKDLPTQPNPNLLVCRDNTNGGKSILLAHNDELIKIVETERCTVVFPRDFGPYAVPVQALAAIQGVINQDTTLYYLQVSEEETLEVKMHATGDRFSNDPSIYSR